MRIISIANEKGGVAKTTTAINVGAGLSILGKKVLLIDFDPQSHLTSGLGIQPIETSKNIYRVLKKDIKIGHAILEKSKYFVVPSSRNLAQAEKEFADKFFVLRDISRELKDYDYVLIDCPPSLGLLTINALTASHEVYITLQCGFLSLQGATHLLETIESVRKKLNYSLKISGVIVTLYDRRRNLSKEVLSDLQEHFGSILFNTPISYNVSLAESVGFGKDIFEYSANSQGAKDYLDLCKEIVEREENDG